MFSIGTGNYLQKNSMITNLIHSMFSAVNGWLRVTNVYAILCSHTYFTVHYCNAKIVISCITVLISEGSNYGRHCKSTLSPAFSHGQTVVDHMINKCCPNLIRDGSPSFFALVLFFLFLFLLLLLLSIHC